MQYSYYKWLIVGRIVFSAPPITFRIRLMHCQVGTIEDVVVKLDIALLSIIRQNNSDNGFWSAMYRLALMQHFLTFWQHRFVSVTLQCIALQSEVSSLIQANSVLLPVYGRSYYISSGRGCLSMSVDVRSCRWALKTWSYIPKSHFQTQDIQPIIILHGSCSLEFLTRSSPPACFTNLRKLSTKQLWLSLAWPKWKPTCSSSHIHRKQPPELPASIYLSTWTSFGHVFVDERTILWLDRWIAQLCPLMLIIDLLTYFYLKYKEIYYYFQFVGRYIAW